MTHLEKQAFVKQSMSLLRKLKSLSSRYGDRLFQNKHLREMMENVHDDPTRVGRLMEYPEGFDVKQDYWRELLGIPSGSHGEFLGQALPETGVARNMMETLIRREKDSILKTRLLTGLGLTGGGYAMGRSAD